MLKVADALGERETPSSIVLRVTNVVDAKLKML